jgi:hypothetical protein
MIVKIFSMMIMIDGDGDCSDNEKEEDDNEEGVMILDILSCRAA